MLDYPERTFSRDAIRQVDATAIERYGIPGIVLMENASRGIARQAGDLIRAASGRRVLILCGGGNNGGDGFAAARHLHNMGLACTIVLTKPADGYRGDAATNLAICRKMGLPIIEAQDDPVAAAERVMREGGGDQGDAGAVRLVIDALMGTGLDKPLRPPLDELVAWINRQTAPVLAVDIPTGLDCDTGRPLGEGEDAAVRAAMTVTMVGRKRGFLQPDARRYTGDVYVVDIGVPREIILELGDPLET